MRSTIDALKAALRPALRVALWAFLGPFLLAVTGFLNEVWSWANAHGQAPFPDVSTLGYAFVAAVVSASSFLVALVIRFAQAKGLFPGQPPIYPTTWTPLPDNRSVLGRQSGSASLACLSVSLAILATVLIAV